MLSPFQWLLRQIAAGASRPPARRRCRALAVEQFESRNVLASVTLAPVADNTMFQDQTSHADGAGPTIFSGETLRGLGARRALINFDVAGNIPAGAHIDSVTLQLHVFKDRSAAHDFGLYRLTASWGEGASNSGINGGDGANALANDATWNVRFTGANPPQPWTTAGGDFNSTPSAVTSVGTSLGTTFFQWTSPQLAADVQTWLNSPSTQFGWMVKEIDESQLGSAVEFDSSEGSTPANRPTLTINFTPPVNRAPTLDPIGDPDAILSNAGQQTINLTGISAGPAESQTITVTAISSNPSLIPDPTVSYSSPSSTGSLSYTPLGDQNGSATITVTVKDNGGTAGGGVDTITRTFNVQVYVSSFVNQAPSFQKGSDQGINPLVTDQGGAVSVPGWATSISPGPAADASQKLNFIVTIVSADTDAAFTVAPGIDSTGNLTFTPAPNAHGIAHISVQLHDNGGTANGGSNISAAQTFDLTITKPKIWHNSKIVGTGAISGLDANNDNQIASNDVVAVVNYINAFGNFQNGKVPDLGQLIPNSGGQVGGYASPFGYLDVTADNFVAPNDALAIINFINAHPNGEGESAASISAQAAASLVQQLDALLVWDNSAGQQRRRS